MNKQPKLSLGPILYFWSRDQVLEFYEWVERSPVDIVYLGETVCSKRNLITTDDWFAIAERLTKAGKEVVLSTLALLEAESELIRLRRICSNDQYMIEANDIGAVHLRSGKPFVTGHSVNVYNWHTVEILAKQGLKRWVLPVELSWQTLADIQAGSPEGVEVEVFAYGRLPLAYSARCFTARSCNRPKDDCDYCCFDYPDGLMLKAQDDTNFLVLNGIQTQSAHTFNLLPELDRMRELSVDVVRISPQSNSTDKIVDIFHKCINREMSLEEGNAMLEPLLPVGSCDGYWHGEAGMAEKTQIGAKKMV